MKGWKSAFFLLGAMMSFQAHAIAGNNPPSTEKPIRTNQEIVEEVKRLQKNIVSFNSDFTLQIYAKDQAKPRREKGTVAFKAPSFWRLEKYHLGEKKPFFLAGCNGKTFWQVDKESKKPEAVIKKDVEKISADQRNALIQEDTGISPLFVFSKELAASISSVTDGQDNTWIFEMALPPFFFDAMQIMVDKVRVEISKETGLGKGGEVFFKGEKLTLVKFENTKFDTTLTAQ